MITFDACLIASNKFGSPPQRHTIHRIANGRILIGERSEDANGRAQGKEGAEFIWVVLAKGREEVKETSLNGVDGPCHGGGWGGGV